MDSEASIGSAWLKSPPSTAVRAMRSSGSASASQVTSAKDLQRSSLAGGTRRGRAWSCTSMGQEPAASERGLR
jgi:hypothetical protein